jgi:putative heme-binding domain-containing protein
LAGGTLAGTAQAAPSAAELEQAGNLFAITCSSSMCHGEGGVGARGPALRNRGLPADFVRTTMLEGRSGTPMPSFKSALSPQEVNAIVAYVMSLGNQGDDGASAPAAIVAAPFDAQAAHGKDLFFDETRPVPCGACHSAQENGGLLGADLVTLGKKSPRELAAAMLHPAPGNPAYPAVTVTTRDGKNVQGIAAPAGPAGTIRIFDVGTAPPVLRSFYAADGAKVAPLDKAVLYTHTLNGYSSQDLADMIAYLKAAGGQPAQDVTPTALGLQADQP